MKEYSTIGKSLPKKDAAAKVMGSAKFGADIQMPRMLFGRVLRSNVAHGILKELDITKAQKLPGVKAVLTAADIPGLNSHGIITKDEPVLVENRIRKVGEPLVLVAAESNAAAAEALSLIEVKIEELPGVFDPVIALEKDAPKVHAQGNIMAERKIILGEINKGFEQSEATVEAHYKTAHQEHAYIEPEVSVAEVNDDIITVWSSTQNPHFDQKEIARILGCNLNRVRVIQVPTGGGFGGKLDISTQVHTALLAQKTRCPVRLVYSREESFIASTKRHPQLIRMKSGVDKAGKLMAFEVEIVADTGAYGSYGPGVITRSLVHATGPYEIPNIHLNAKFVYTNNPTSGAMRGFGVPQVAFAHEQQMDALAEKIGMDAVEFRLLNCHRAGSITATGQKLHHSVGIRKTIQKAAASFDQEFHTTDVTVQNFNKKRGRGIGCMWYGIGNTGMPNPAGAFVDILDDGSTIVHVGCADIGQGSSTIIAQIVAEELQIEFDQIKVIAADTLVTPDGGATSASRQTYVSGNAAKLAAANAKQAIIEEAALALKTRIENLQYGQGQIYAQDAQKGITFGEAVKLCRSKGKMPIGSGWFNPETTALDQNTGRGEPYAAYAYAAQIAEVEVDIETGQVSLIRLAAAHDVGKAINPSNAEGQIEGGCIMGQGFALYEDFIVDKGRIKTGSLTTYLLPTSMDAAEVLPLIVEEEEPSGPFGAKGVGEPALIPTAAAIANAIYDAVGIRITELPITAERVLQKLKEK